MFKLGLSSDTMSLGGPKRVWESNRPAFNLPDTRTAVRRLIPVRRRSIEYVGERKQLTKADNLVMDFMYPMPQFFNCHKKFSEGLNSLISQSSIGYPYSSNYFDSMSEITSEYDQYLSHLHEDMLDVFFGYTSTLEGVLLVLKRRHMNINGIQDILIKLKDNYYKIYSSMISKNQSSDISSLNEELSCIRGEINRRGLMPTLDEYDEEIAETVASMDNEEKKNLARALSLSD